MTMTMHEVIFDVDAPAQSTTSGIVTVPDPHARYTAHIPTLPHVTDAQQFHQIGGAMILSMGTKVGDRYLGCTYIAPPYAIPGLGHITVRALGH